MKHTLLKLSYQFRNAINYIKDTGLYEYNSFFSRFPSGCCGDTSDLLAQYFYDHGIVAKYVCGTWHGETSYDSQSHAWLLVGNLVVDITGDQFRYSENFLCFDKQVYVGTINEFYKLFEVELCDVREYNSSSILTGEQKSIYKKIIAHINKGFV